MESSGALRPSADGPPAEVRALAQFLRTLMASLGTPPDRYSSWAFQDPDAMQRYLDGRALPPRDVLDSLFRDLAQQHGSRVGPDVERRGYRLHAAAVRALDTVPGRVEELRAELAELEEEYEHTARREHDLADEVRRQQSRLRSGQLGHTDHRRQLIGIHEELSRTRVMRARTHARYEELADRLQAAARHEEAAGHSIPAPRPATGGPSGARFAGAFEERTPRVSDRPDAAGAAAPPSGARFAGTDGSVERRGGLRRSNRGAGQGGTGRSGGRGDRSGDRSGKASGAEDERHRPTAEHLANAPDGVTFAASFGPAASGAAQGAPPEQDAAAQVADTLGRLREEGRAQEAQELLWEAAAWPPQHFPALLAALAEAGRHSDAATLLWELASRSPQEVAAYSVWLVKARRDDEWRELLSQTSTRPHAAVADTVTALSAAGWDEQVSVLLREVVRSRPPECIADLAADLSGAGQDQCLRELLHGVETAPRERRLRISAALRLSGLPDSVTGLSG